ncbi:hypothetical protein [Hymenobacter sp. APR13]|uniref:hypothetical protein n=1 Tax=Hymenobacter sp. APR13 TaxID=1356852 RepID=UPI0004E04AA9|nr:hypothetical protein [Hymenobacter sp. APR13]AII53012.1 hypothetical protein N008_13630 [Hymenobacter sp. APR13]
MKNPLLFLSLMLSCVACQKDDDASPKGVTIRVRNASPYAFESVLVNTNDGEQTYGALAMGQSTTYKSFTSAYRYAYVKVVTNGQTVEWQPIDYVGEKKLEDGKYTYVLNIEDLANRRISLQLEKN